MRSLRRLATSPLAALALGIALAACSSDPASDAGTTGGADAGVVADAQPAADAQGGADAQAAPDAQGAADATTGMDAEPAADAQVSADAEPAADAQAAADAAAAADAQAAADAEPAADAQAAADAAGFADAQPAADASAPDAGVNLVCDPTELAAPGCGGAPQGTYVYRAACGNVQIPSAAAGACPTATFLATSHVVSGSLVFTGNSYTLASTDVAHVRGTFPAACAVGVGGCAGLGTVLGAALGTSASCTGTTSCTCDFDLTVAASETGTYSTNAGVITTTPSSGTGSNYNYCLDQGALRYREATDTTVYVLSP